MGIAIFGRDKPGGPRPGVRGHRHALRTAMAHQVESYLGRAVRGSSGARMCPSAKTVVSIRYAAR